MVSGHMAQHNIVSQLTHMSVDRLGVLAPVPLGFAAALCIVVVVAFVLQGRDNDPS